MGMSLDVLLRRIGLHPPLPREHFASTLLGSALVYIYRIIEFNRAWFVNQIMHVMTKADIYNGA